MNFKKTNNSFTQCCLLSALVILTFAGCQKSEGEIEEVPDTKPPIVTERLIPIPTEVGMMDIDLSPGRRDALLPLTHERNWNYSILVPENVGEEPIPLFIGLHGGNEDPGAGAAIMNDILEPALKNLDAIVFAPVGGIWWTEINSARLIEFVRLAKEHWPIDTTKVVILGYSNGGTASTYFPLNYPGVFDAAIPMAGDFTEQTCLDIPTYFIHGSQDQFYSSNDLKEKVDALTQQGCIMEIDIIDGYFHGGGPLVRESLRNAGLWLTHNIW